jgi:hypothetical protein
MTLYVTVLTVDGRSKSQQVLSPEIVRVFTGLFLTVENLAEVYYTCMQVDKKNKIFHCYGTYGCVRGKKIYQLFQFLLS